MILAGATDELAGVRPVPLQLRAGRAPGRGVGPRAVLGALQVAGGAGQQDREHNGRGELTCIGCT